MTNELQNTPATIVTSTMSKNNYANNIESLNQANNAIKKVTAGQTASGIAASLGLTPEQFLKLNPDWAAQGGQNDYRGLTGNIKIGQTYNTGQPITPPSDTRNNNVGGDGAKNGSTGATTTDTGDTRKIIKSVSNADGSSFATYEDGSGVISYSDGQTYQIPKGMDYGIAKINIDNIRTMEANKSNIENTMNRFAQYDVNTDPAAIAAAQQIRDSYSTLIQQMKDKNAILAGVNMKNSARYGMMQYANEMDSNFKSMELDKANQRVADLETKMLNAIQRSNDAYKSGNVKALEAAQKEYQQTISEQSKAVMDFAKMVNDQVKANNDEIKALQAEKKATIATDIQLSSATSLEIANTIMESGIKDQNQIDQYIDAMADQLGITDPIILRSAVDKAIQQNVTFDLGVQQKKKTLNETSTSGTSDASVKKNYIQNINSVLGSIRGSDNYVDPYEYIGMYQQWIAKYSDKEFKTEFPAENYINPKSYKLLPPQLKPKL